jgi:hypothetical protein
MEPNNICEYCKKTFSTKYTLFTHQKTVKSCKNNIEKKSYYCEYCKKSFSTMKNLVYHTSICDIKKDIDNKIQEDIKNKENKKIIENEIEKYKNEIEKNHNEELQKLKEDLTKSYADQIQSLTISNKILETRLEDTVKSYERQIELLQNNPQNFIFEYNSETDSESESEKEQIKEYKQQERSPLVLNDIVVSTRSSDNFVDLTELCKAGNKNLNHWKSLDKTIEFLNELSATTGIPVVELVKQIQGGNGSRHTWGHPQVAVNVAQWISPKFDVLVSRHIFDLYTTGNVELKNFKLNQEIQVQNKKIKMLRDKVLQKHPREKYDCKYVIYIITTENRKAKNEYKIGKTKNLTNRKGVYETTEPHEIVYYRECRDSEHMKIAEQYVFYALKNNRVQANHEWFQLPYGLDVSYFSNIIADCVDKI